MKATTTLRTGVMMTNPLFNSSFFVTPKDWNDLQDMIERYTGSEKAVAYQVMMFTQNLCHKLVEESITADGAE